MDPVTHGKSSGSTCLPSRAFAAPACSRSATAITSSTAFLAPAPTRIATFSPALSTSAARCRSTSVGTTVGGVQPTPEKTAPCFLGGSRSEEHTSELQSLMRISYAVFCLKKKKHQSYNQQPTHTVN